MVLAACLQMYSMLVTKLHNKSIYVEQSNGNNKFNVVDLLCSKKSEKANIPYIT